MKQLTIGVFASRADAETAITHLHKEAGIPTDDISYVYRTTDDEIKEVDASDVSEGTPAEGAGTGAWVGGAVGAIAGLATVAGIIPVIGPIFVAGPLISALGIGAGVVGTTAAGAVTGAVAGGIIGALVNLGVPETVATHYSDRVYAGDVLVATHADEDADVEGMLTEYGALDINTFRPAV